MIQPDTVPPVPPEGILLKRAREGRRRRKLSMRAAARAADVSETTRRHAEAGSEPKGSLRLPYRVGDATLARMALVVDVTPAELRAAGRSEAAEILEEMGSRAQEGTDDALAAAAADFFDAGEKHLREHYPQALADEMINALRARGVPELATELARQNRRTGR